jgi:hypothetical protein
VVPLIAGRLDDLDDHAAQRLRQMCENYAIEPGPGASRTAPI